MPGALKPLGERWHERLVRVTGTFEVQPTPSALRHLSTWLDLLATWNARVDLTAARGPDELVDLMVADASLLARHVPQGASVVDVGSGSGAPGLPLGLLRPDLTVTLVEPQQKRVSFLRTVLGSIGESSVKAMRVRGEELVGGAPFGEAVARATLPPQDWLALGAKLVIPRGGVWVFLARESAPAKAGWRAALDVEYRWPLTGAARRAVRYEPVP